MKKRSVLLIVLLLLVPVLIAQKKLKPWDQWNKNDAAKILNDSAWAQTQKEFLSADRFVKGGGVDRSKSDVDFHIRFLSAKPLRQGLVRSILTGSAKLNDQQQQQLFAFIDQKFEDIVVAVTCESTEERLVAPVLQEFARFATANFQRETYLETKTKKVYLKEYIAPSNDGLGAKFVFPRTMDGQAYVVPEIGDVRFYSTIPGMINITLDKRFKIANFMYEGNLEF